MEPCKQPGCKRPIKAQGYCATHYKNHIKKERQDMLKSIIHTVDQLKLKRPDLAAMLEDVVKEARPLFREFKEVKGTPTKRLATLEAEIARLRAEQSKSEALMRAYLKANQKK